MGDFKVEYSSLISLSEHIKEIPRFIEDEAIKVVKTITSKHLARTKAETPVDTGHLRRNWQRLPLQCFFGIIRSGIYNSVEYANYVELGHRTVNQGGETAGFVPGKKMMRKSFLRADQELNDAANKLIKEAGEYINGNQ